MKYTPLFTNVLVKEVKEETPEKEGLILEIDITDNTVLGEVVAVGNKVIEDIGIGQKVRFHAGFATLVSIEDSPHYVVEQKNVLLLID